MSQAPLSEQLRQLLQRKLGSIKDPQILLEIAEYAKDRIYKRVKSGQGVDSPGGEYTTLAPLSPRYIKYRQKFALDSTTTPTKSNLTLTGEMLASLETDVDLSTGRCQVLITDPDELQKAIFTNQRRPWINLSRPEKDSIVRKLRDLIKKVP